MTSALFALEDRAATFSPCRTWRYALERRWGSGPFVLFVALNPSTADETVDDATIRVCTGFARRWGFGGLLMGNLFAFRATKPRDMEKAPDPVGPDTDVWLTTMAVRSSLVVAAWGAHRMAETRAVDVLPLLGEVHALTVTKGGAPGHPLYKPADLKPVPFGRDMIRGDGDER